jgi:predicted Zn-dependent protease
MSRREQLEQMLAQSPGDPFLRYGLALECAKDGELEEALRRLEKLIADESDYVAAYFQAAQLLAQWDRLAEAHSMLDRGIAAAQRTGDLHAAEEMQGMKAGLDEA